MQMSTARHRLTRMCNRCSSKLLRRNSASSAPSKVSQKNPIPQLAGRGLNQANLSLGKAVGGLHLSNLLALGEGLNDLRTLFDFKTRAWRLLCQISRFRQSARYSREVGVEIHVVGGFDAPLRLVRFLGGCGKLGQAPVIGRV